MKRRLTNLFIALDQFLFCLVTLGHSSPDETLCAAAWRWDVQGKPFGWLRRVLDTLFWFDKDHCMNAYISELNSRHLPRIYPDSRSQYK